MATGMPPQKRGHGGTVGSQNGEKRTKKGQNDPKKALETLHLR